MKATLKIFGITFLVLITSNIFGQSQFSPGPPPDQNMLEQLTEKLKLNDVQVNKLETILEISKNKMDKLRKNMNSDKEKQMKEMGKIMKEQDKEIEKLLTVEQKKKYAEIQKEREERRPPMRDRQGPPPPPDGSARPDRF